MTGNQIKGKGFRGALRYNLEKVEKGDAEVLDHSFTQLSEKCILKEVLMVRSQRPYLQKYFYHTSINFHPGENLDNQMMKQIGLDYLDANGFNQHQYIMFRHYDADHPTFIFWLIGLIILVRLSVIATIMHGVKRFYGTWKRSTTSPESFQSPGERARHDQE